MVAVDLRGCGFGKDGESITMEKACDLAFAEAGEMDIGMGGSTEGTVDVATLDGGDLIAALVLSGRRSITMGVIAGAGFGEDRCS